MGAGLLLLLVGLGVLSIGILIGRYYVPDDRRLKRTARHARSYMLAINHLLARDRDRAIDELRAVVEEDVEQLEPYFALAALFRARGEWERAVRVHQAIELRADADKHARLRAMYELGLDFRGAGMPRRATRAMEDCLEADTKHEGALRALCGLYEEQGRFADAAQAWARLDKLRGGERGGREQHLWAAAATRAVEAGDVDEARRCLKQAERLGDDDAHVLAAAAEVAAARGNAKLAAKKLQRALQVAPDLAAYFAPALEEAERQQLEAELGETGSPAGDDADELARLATDRTARALDEVIAEIGAKPTVVLARAQLRARSDLEAALEDLRDVAKREPSLLTARVHAARVVLALGDAKAAQKELAALVAPGGPLAERTESEWVCGQCGKITPQFFWRCDACRQWGTAWFDWHRTRVQPEQPRERRAAPRSRMLGAGGSMPGSPAEPRGGGSDEREPGGRAGLLGRAGAWISGAWSGMRGKGAAERDARPDDDRLSRE